ncbi:hypothetical protein EJ08DRAFT_285832 [Tothia fuscella]|uniref:MYND-type domain-containing protein n=1 Tax=Tothia fuscella TaxID=1048955 RepID=A0A9P4P024_9PEZI|nr:hypothetical protein EJ08DRAFT_285832 [Tothia fuscella]
MEYKCDDPDCTKDIKLQLCGRCRSVRYCSKECQQAAWISHKPHCINPMSPKYLNVIPTDCFVDPSTPANLLQLQSRPNISQAKFERLSTPANSSNSLDMLRSPILDDAIVEHFLELNNFDDADELDLETTDYLANGKQVTALLKQWVYDKFTHHAEIKALRIVLQVLKLQMLRNLMGSPRALPVSFENLCRQLPKHWLALDLSVCHMGLQSQKGRWLHKSLLRKLPQAHDDSRFAFNNPNTATPDDVVIATVMTLNATGIDEATFWKLADWRDKMELTKNNNAMDRSLATYGVLSRDSLPSFEFEWQDSPGGHVRE